MPLRSSACFLCRARKIRCDETRPACARCRTHGVPCPGYRNAHPDDIEIRDQTGLTIERAHFASRPRRIASDRYDTSSSTLASASRDDNSTPIAVSKEHVDETSNNKIRASVSIASRFQEQDAQINVPFSCLKSPSVYRLQLRSIFLRLYMPHTNRSKDASLEFFHLDYLRTLIQLSPTSPALIYGLDALSLVQIGSVHKDQDLLQQAVQAYARALKSLAQALSKPNSVQDDSLLAAATVLALCEFFDEIKQQGQGWINHQHGLQRLIEARGPKSITSRLAEMLYWNTVNATIPIALLRRSAIVLPVKWQILESKILSDHKHAEAYRLGRALPGLLERHDGLDPSDCNFSHDLDKLVDECEQLKVSMRSFYNTWANPQPLLDDIAEFQTFNAALHHESILTHAYKFPSLMSAFRHCESRLMMYLLLANLHSLHNMRREQEEKQRHQQQHSVSLRSPADFEGMQQAGTHSHDPGERQERSSNVSDAEYNAEAEELLQLIVDLCRCVPFFADPAHATVGHIACFLPLHLAAYHFHIRKLWRWLHWVRLVRESVFDRGLSMPAVSLPELPPRSVEEV